MQSIDSIIFDLDGTLWDTVNTVCGIWNNVLVQAGFSPVMDYDKLSACMGMLIDDIIAKLIPQASADQAAVIKKECLSREITCLSELGGVLYNGVEETLQNLSKKYKLYIVSNCQEGYIEAFYKAHRLDKYFLDYECAGRTKLSKGANIKLLSERNELKSPVYVGDTKSDLDAAKEAGISFCYAKYGFGDVEEDNCNYVAESFYDLNGIF